MAVPSFSAEHLAALDALFRDMEPANLAGEPFTPSLHQDDFLLEDVPPESENEDELADLSDANVGSFTSFTGSEIPTPLLASASHSSIMGGAYLSPGCSARHATRPIMLLPRQSSSSAARESDGGGPQAGPARGNPGLTEIASSSMKRGAVLGANTISRLPTPRPPRETPTRASPLHMASRTRSVCQRPRA